MLIAQSLACAPFAMVSDMFKIAGNYLLLVVIQHRRDGQTAVENTEIGISMIFTRNVFCSNVKHLSFAEWHCIVGLQCVLGSSHAIVGMAVCEIECSNARHIAVQPIIFPTQDRKSVV